MTGSNTCRCFAIRIRWARSFTFFESSVQRSHFPTVYVEFQNTIRGNALPLHIWTGGRACSAKVDDAAAFEMWQLAEGTATDIRRHSQWNVDCWRVRRASALSWEMNITRSLIEISSKQLLRGNGTLSGGLQGNERAAANAAQTKPNGAALDRTRLSLFQNQSNRNLTSDFVFDVIENGFNCGYFARLNEIE